MASSTAGSTAIVSKVLLVIILFLIFKHIFLCHFTTFFQRDSISILLLQITYLTFQFFYHIGISRILILILHFIWVFLHIIKFPFINVIIEMNQLIAVGTYSVMRLYIVPFRIFKILIVGRFTPIRFHLFITLQQSLYTLTLYIGRYL